MDPATMLLVASAGVSAASTVYNFFAGQGRIDNANAALQRQKKQLEEQTAHARELLAQQTVQARKDAVASTAQTTAGEAQAGILGPMNDIITQDTSTKLNDQIDQKVKEANYQIDLQYSQGMDQIKSGFNDVTDQANQFGVNFLTGMLGVGLTGAGAIIKGFNADQPANGSLVPNSSMEPDAYNKAADAYNKRMLSGSRNAWW